MRLRFRDISQLSAQKRVSLTLICKVLAGMLIQIA